MKWWVALLAALAVFGPMASSLAAQERTGPSRADLALYAGGSWTTPWLETGEGTTFGIGFNPVVGGYGHFWLSRRFGARLHLAYLPSDLPQPNRPDAFGPGGPTTEDGRDPFAGDLSNWFYDLSLAVRPFAAPGRTGPLSTLYLFAGGGAFTPRPHGGPDRGCVAVYALGDACLPYAWRDATVGQATGGLGIGLIPLTTNLAVFAEVGTHLYSSPFRIGEAWTGIPPCPSEVCRADDRMAMTTRLVGGLALAMGRPRPIVVPPPPPPPPPPAPEQLITLCVVLDGIPRYVDAAVRPEQRDTVVVTEQGIQRPLRAVYPAPPPTASGRDWFVRDESLFLEGREYVRFGVPREMDVGQVRRVGAYLGVPLFASAEGAEPPATLFVPVQDGCVFQPYQLQERVRRVRG